MLILSGSPTLQPCELLSAPLIVCTEQALTSVVLLQVLLGQNCDFKADVYR